jgi:hypothetical protein
LLASARTAYNNPSRHFFSFTVAESEIVLQETLHLATPANPFLERQSAGPSSGRYRNLLCW